MADHRPPPTLTDPTGREHILRGEVTRIGRALECDIVITSKRVSREHARVRREGQHTLLEDAGSTNGTLLNEERIAGTVELRDGDSIAVGDVTFQFHDPDTTFRDSGSIDLEVLPEQGIVRVNRKLLSLSPKEFTLLVYLYGKRGQVCSKEEIGRAVWPEYQESAFDYQIENLVRRLRNRLEPDPDQPQVLITVRGLGYRLLADG
jgi:pSer/pThr/pTyr-binding forkhead associated (FHA) protein